MSNDSDKNDKLNEFNDIYTYFAFIFLFPSFLSNSYQFVSQKHTVIQLQMHHFRKVQIEKKTKHIKIIREERYFSNFSCFENNMKLKIEVKHKKTA